MSVAGAWQAFDEDYASEKVRWWLRMVERCRRLYRLAFHWPYSSFASLEGELEMGIQTLDIYSKNRVVAMDKCPVCISENVD